MQGVEWTNVKYTHSGIHWETPLNINLNIKNKRQDCKTSAGCVWWGSRGREESEWRLRWGYMVDWLHIPIWNRTKKPLTIASSGEGGDWLGEIIGVMQLI
jgi:hypothetical protein